MGRSRSGAGWATDDAGANRTAIAAQAGKLLECGGLAAEPGDSGQCLWASVGADGVEEGAQGVDGGVVDRVALFGAVEGEEGDGAVVADFEDGHLGCIRRAPSRRMTSPLR